MKKIPLFLTLFGSFLLSSAPTFANCPTDNLLPFLGEWKGYANLIAPNGSPIARETNTNSFNVVKENKCQQFSVRIQYYDEDKIKTRLIEFTGKWSSLHKRFELWIGEHRVGVLRQIDSQTLLANFQIPSKEFKAIYCDELINLSQGEKEDHQIRTIQCFKGGEGGMPLQIRVVNEFKNK